MSPTQKGILFTVIGAICFSAKAIFVKLAYLSFDVSDISLLTLRYLFALPIFMVIAIIRYRNDKIESMSSKSWLMLVFAAVMGYYLASWFDFSGLKYIPASIERVILFTYPTLVVIFSCLFFRKKISRKTIYALIICYAGILIIAVEPRFFSGENFALGATLIFLSSITYALYLVFSGELSQKLGSVNANALGMIFSSLFVFLHMGFLSDESITGLPLTIYLYGFAIAIISTVIPTFLMMEGIRLLGANRASIIGSLGPVSTIIMGYLFLGERLTVQELLGSVLIMAGVFLIGK
jgi:drug/metabolite transporter (DMT)-like permease